MRSAWCLVGHREHVGQFGMEPAYLGNLKHHPGHLDELAAEQASVE